MNREQIGKLAVQSNRIFLDSAREALASFDAEAVDKSMLSWIRLHYGTEIGEAEPTLESFLKLQETAFLSLLDRGAIEPIATITPFGQKAIEALRRHCGVGVETLPAPVPVLSAEEKLEQQVKSDWTTLSSQAIREKMRTDKAYRQCFERLSASDAITSQVTHHAVIEGVGS